MGSMPSCYVGAIELRCRFVEENLKTGTGCIDDGFSVPGRRSFGRVGSGFLSTYPLFLGTYHLCLCIVLIFQLLEALTVPLPLNLPGHIFSGRFHRCWIFWIRNRHVTQRLASLPSSYASPGSTAAPCWVRTQIWSIWGLSG
jgi:hypothetical protein